MNKKITHFNFDFKSENQRYVFYMTTFFLFFIYILPINFEIKNFSFLKILFNTGLDNIITSIVKSSIYMLIMITIISLSPNFIHNFHPDLKYRIGRSVILFSILVIAFYIFYFLIDKSITNKILFYNLISILGIYMSWLLMVRDLYIKKYGYPEKLKVKEINKKYNFKESRINNRSYSYYNKFITNNALDPCLLSFVLVFNSISFLLITKFNVSISTICIFIVLLYILVINNKKLHIKIIQIILFSLSIILSYYISDFSNINRENIFKNKERNSGNTTYSKTRIGSTDNDLFDMYNLLFRVNWPEKNNSYLLPMASYNYYNEKYNSWLLSGDLRDYVKLSPSLTTVEFNKNVENEKERKINSYESSELVYKIDNLKDITDQKLEKIGSSSVTLYGVFNANNKSQYHLPIPFNSKYIAGDQLNKNSFFEYKTGSVSINGYYGYKDWSIYFDIYNNNQNIAISPVREDLIYPKEYQKNIKKFIEDANVKIDDSREVKVKKILEHFGKNYKYDLDTRIYGTNLPRTINDFLTIDKRGHCEYFATSMTFILRELGIPARYVVGYSVNEKSEEEGDNTYWVRAKDAHAWISYWNGKAWVNADSTPSSIDAFENLHQHSYFSDFIEKIRFKFNNIVISPIVYISISIFIISSLSIIFYFYRDKNKKDQIYFKDNNFKKFKRKIAKFEKIYPNNNNELYMTWALKTNDEKLINIVKNYYNRYKVKV